MTVPCSAKIRKKQLSRSWWKSSPGRTPSWAVIWSCKTYGGGKRARERTLQIRSLRNDNKISRQYILHSQHFIVMAFPKKNSVLGQFSSRPPSPNPLKNANSIFTREGCGCFQGLFGGSRGRLRESPRKIAGKICPESRNAVNSRISGTGKGKPAGNLEPTLPGPCPHLPCGVPFEIDSSSLLEFFWMGEESVPENALSR